MLRNLDQCPIGRWINFHSIYYIHYMYSCLQYDICFKSNRVYFRVICDYNCKLFKTVTCIISQYEPEMILCTRKVYTYPKF